ncbi:MAG TPA: hypothetical protein VMS22_19530 [Candidatus Eisenbacteria bacterium]|nr:hypothetical protein [Candidatus Eisenbacteria bacterium]
MNTTRTAAIVLAALLVIDLGHGFAAVLCKNRAGGVILREKCKKKETQLDLVQLGAVCPKGDPGPPGSGSRVVDANGRSVGPLVSGANVLMVAGGQAVIVRADTSGFPADRALAYTTSDCSGTAYVEVFEPLAPRTVTIGGTLYYPGLPLQPVHILSNGFADTTPTDCTNGGGVVLPSGLCCEMSDRGTEDAGVAMTLDLASLGFAPPFHAEVVP